MFYEMEPLKLLSPSPSHCSRSDTQLKTRAADLDEFTLGIFLFLLSNNVPELQVAYSQWSVQKQLISHLCGAAATGFASWQGWVRTANTERSTQKAKWKTRCLQCKLALLFLHFFLLINNPNVLSFYQINSAKLLQGRGRIWHLLLGTSIRLQAWSRVTFRQ